AVALIALLFFRAPTTANAQLAEGDIVVLEVSSDGTPGGPAALFSISATGNRTVLTDFKSAAQGPTSDTPIGVAAESATSVLVFGARGITRVTLPGGMRTTLGAIPGNMTASSSGVYRLAPAQGIYAVNPVNGQSTLLSDFKNFSQGKVLTNA